MPCRWKWKSFGRRWLILDLIGYFATLLSTSATGLLYHDFEYDETGEVCQRPAIPAPTPFLEQSHRSAVANFVIRHSLCWINSAPVYTLKLHFVFADVQACTLSLVHIINLVIVCIMFLEEIALAATSCIKSHTLRYEPFSHILQLFVTRSLCIVPLL